jgi:hypothetical protein
LHDRSSHDDLIEGGKHLITHDDCEPCRREDRVHLPPAGQQTR